jgi:hypothetical protein
VQQFAQLLDLGGQLGLRFRLALGAKLRQPQRILGVGLGPPAGALGEVAHLFGIGQADRPALIVGEGHQG